MLIIFHHHYHRPLIPLCGGGTTCFLLPFSSIAHHHRAQTFYFHVILHTVHPSFPRPTSTRVPIYIHTHHSFCYLTFIPPHNMAYQANLLLLIFSNTCATFKLPLIYSFLILSILVTPCLYLGVLICYL
jgi:hypothetical protein